MDSLKVGVAPYFRSGLLEPDYLSSANPGYLLAITRNICEIANYNCTLIPWTDPYLGTVVNHTWVGGFLGALRNGTFDTTLPDFFPTEARLPHFSFSDSHIAVETFFVTRHPTNLQMSTLLRPLQWQTWAATAATISCVAIIITGATALNLKKFRIVATLKVLLITVLKVSTFLTRRSFRFRIQQTVGRMILLFWGLNALVLLSCYAASLLSAMLNTSTPLPFHNFASLVECLNAGVCRMVLSPYADWFTMEIERAKSADFVALRTALSHNPPLMADTVAQTLRFISDSQRHFVVSFPFEVDGHLGSNCTFSLVPYDLAVGSRSTFVFRKGDPTALQIGKALRSLQGLGLDKKIATDSRSIDRCRGFTTKTGVTPIRIDSLLGIFIVLLVGLFLAAILVLFERLTSTVHRNPSSLHTNK